APPDTHLATQAAASSLAAECFAPHMLSLTTPVQDWLSAATRAIVAEKASTKHRSESLFFIGLLPLFGKLARSGEFPNRYNLLNPVVRATQFRPSPFAFEIEPILRRRHSRIAPCN